MRKVVHRAGLSCRRLSRAFSLPVIIETDNVPVYVKDVAHDILRHRLAISYRAEAESITSDDLLDQILSKVAIVEE